MGYIDFIKKFWIQHNAYSLTVTDTALFFYLLETNNLCRWEDTFNRNNTKIMADLSISFPTLSKSRNKLKQIGLIDFKTKNGSGIVKYTLKKYFKVCDEVAFEVSSEVGNEVGGEVTPPIYNVHVEDKDKDKEYFLKKNACEIVGVPENVFERSLDECFMELKSNLPWMETVCMNTRSSGHKDFAPPDFYDYLEKFFMKLQNEGETAKSPKEAMMYFSRWLNKELERKKDEKRNNKANGRGCIIPEAATEQYSAAEKDLNASSVELAEWINGLRIGR